MEKNLTDMLRKLRLSGLSDSLEVRLHEAAAAGLSHREFLELILQDELLVRGDRQIDRRIIQANFRDVRRLEDFDFAFNTSIKRSQIFELATCRFIREHRDLPWLALPVRGNLDHFNTPLVTDICAGYITVADPAHPLYGKRLQLFGLANLPSHIRSCQVEITPDLIGHVAIASTNLGFTPIENPTILTALSARELLKMLETLSPKTRRSSHERKKSTGLGKPRRRNSKRGAK